MSGTGGQKSEYLELDGPSASCGYCRFGQALKGTWSVEDGRLVFRAAADALSGRGPDFRGCSEGSGCGEFAGIRGGWPHANFTDEEFAALKETARKAREDEMRAWAESRSGGDGGDHLEAE